MSERMIELQRAKLGLPPMVRPPAPTTGSSSMMMSSSSSASMTPSAPSAYGNNANNTMHHMSMTTANTMTNATTAQHATPAPRFTPQQAAASALYAEEEQLQTFLHRLQRREDHHGATVPTALTRRMLQRQGVGYLDDMVASVVSATADRFLATLLHQAVVCRDQRIKGAELAREEAKQRRKHIQQHQADDDDRKRRKLEREEERTKENHAAIAAAEALKAGAAATAATASAPATSPAPAPKSKKKKKTETENGNGGPDNSAQEDDDFSDDSLDEEEDYYEGYYQGHDEEDDDENDDDEEDESRFMLVLRDLERPLEAWDVRLTGKVGLGAAPLETIEANDEQDSDDPENGTSQPNADEVDDSDYPPSPSSKTPLGSPAGKSDTHKSMESSDSRASTPAPASAKSAPSPAPKPPPAT